MKDLTKLARSRCFMLDMDGTFYLGDKLLPGALEFLELMERRGTRCMFLTNNSSRSRKEYVAKLACFGVEIDEKSIFTSGEATALWLKRERPGARICVIGTPALEDEFRRFGFELVDDDPEAVVLGFDTTLTYEKLCRLCDFARAGLPYIATHPDINCPTESGFIPDIGAIMELVATSTGRRPDVIIGKPYAPMAEALAVKTELDLDQITMVGDRLYTDIALGRNGLSTVLVLSGETAAEDLENSEFTPDYVMRDLAELVDTLERMGESA